MFTTTAVTKINRQFDFTMHSPYVEVHNGGKKKKTDIRFFLPARGLRPLAADLAR